MKIYFTGSTSQESNKKRYKKIIDIIEKQGHKNINYIYFPTDSKKYKEAEKKLSGKNVYDYQTSLMNKADVLIADISTPSITVGYQIDYAINKKIPTIVIYKKSKDFRLPVVLTHPHFGLLKIEEYNDTDELKSILERALEDIKSGAIKFNFYINLQLHNYLNRRAAHEGASKSDVIRDIIEDEMRKNPY